MGVSETPSEFFPRQRCGKNPPCDHSSSSRRLSDDFSTKIKAERLDKKNLSVQKLMEETKAVGDARVEDNSRHFALPVR